MALASSARQDKNAPQTAPTMTSERNTCKLRGCDKPRSVKSLGVCMMHYHRYRRTGSFGAAENSRSSFSFRRKSDTRESAERLDSIRAKLGGESWRVLTGRGTVELIGKNGKSERVGSAFFHCAIARGWIRERGSMAELSAKGRKAILALKESA